MAELISEIEGKPISIFLGAGVSLPCGGPSWNELFLALKKRFPSGVSDDFFKYMQEIIGYDNKNRAEVEDFIRERLASVSASDSQKYLFSIPWKAALTTNYDLLPETIQETMDGKRKIMSIVNPDDQIEQDKDNYLYCLKLLGDHTYSYSDGGWMVLSSSDLFSASERRTKFFNYFRNLATSGHIIYLGYSFEDDLVFLLLSQMKTVLRRFPWKSYAITPSEPRKEIHEKLKSIGVDWVKGTLDDFVEASKKIFGKCPSSAPSLSGELTLHRVTFNLDQSIFANIKKKFSILFDPCLRYHNETPEEFLRGRCKSFYPYVFNWDFKRKTNLIWSNEELDDNTPEDLLKLIEKCKIEDLSQNSFSALVGIAGSGKSILINRLAFDWYQTGNPVIFIKPDNLNIDVNALDGLITEIREKYSKIAFENNVDHPKPLRWLIVADDCGPLLNDLKMLKAHLLSNARPADIVLVSRQTDTPVERLRNYGLDYIYKIDDTVLEEEKDEFINHFKRFNFFDEEIALKNLGKKEINKSFFSLIYSSLEQSNKTIKELVADEYEKLDDESKKVYRLVSLIQSYQLKPLTPLLIKAQSIDSEWLDFQVKNGPLAGVLSFTEHGNIIETNHRVLAEIVASHVYKNSKDRKNDLLSIISTITIGDITEMTLLDNLLNRRIERDIGPHLILDDKIELFNKALQSVKSKPLLIHLGRILTSAKKFNPAKRVLKEAHTAFVQGFDVRGQHVIDAEARVDFAVAENEIGKEEFENALDALEEADRKFNEAKINPRLTPHPYEGAARTYITKARLLKDQYVKWQYILSAMAEINYVDSYLGQSLDTYVLKKETENFLEEIGFNETDLEKMGDLVGKGNGYAYLAEIEKSHKSYPKALALVNKGLSYDPNSIWLMRLKVQLLRSTFSNDHTTIRRILDDYSAFSSEKYDVELSFELAKETYISGAIRLARRLFRNLFTKAKHHPRRYIPRDVDRWIVNQNPMRVNGTILRAPTEENPYGLVTTTFPHTHRDNVTIRIFDIQYDYPRTGDRVSYEIVFNMKGPEASRVRKI